MQTRETRPGFWRCWLVALRPYSFSASLVPVLFGGVLAYTLGYAPQIWQGSLAMAGVLCLHAAANLLNDVYDYRRGVDREVLPASGALVRGWLQEKHLYRAAMGFCLLGLVAGVVLFLLHGWGIALLGLAGVLLALAYTRDGLCLKYVGAGDLAVFLAFGVLPVLGGWWVQTGRFAWYPVFWSLPLAAPTMGILHANNWRDRQTDAAQGCRTLANRLSHRACRRLYRFFVLFPFLGIAVAFALHLLPGINMYVPSTIWLVLLALPQAVQLAVREADTMHPRFLLLVARTARFQLLFGGLLIAAFWLERAT